MSRMMRRAFTLVELLTVLAITAIMLTIIIIPMIQAFSFTRAAEGFTTAQESGRRLIEQITREIENSAGVRDNDGNRGSLAVVVPGWDGTDVTALAPYAKLDILMPAKGDPSNRRNGAYVNPDTGIADPTSPAPMGQVNLPVSPGLTIKRYYISLKNPLNDQGTGPGRYYNPYVDYVRDTGQRWQNIGIGEDNLYVLRVAEVAPIIFQGGTFQINAEFFADDDGDGRADLDDPFFMSLDAPGGPVLTAPQRAAKIARIRAWVRKSIIVSEFRRFDMIQPLFDKGSRALLVAGNVPRINTLIQFRPTTVASEPATGAVALALGNESDSAANLSPDVFRTKNGAWSSAVVRFYPSGYNPGDLNNNDYMVGRFDARAANRGYRLYHYDPDSDPDNDDRNGDNNDLELFDVAAYLDWTSAGAIYPLTRGMVSADGNSGWLSNAALRSRFAPFIPDLAGGKVLTSFGIHEWGIDDPTGTLPPRPDENLPSKGTGPELTPLTDPAPVGLFSDLIYQNNINRQFNKIWADNPSLQVPGGVHRYIDLRVTNQADGTPSPLHPDPTIGFAQARIVPGSEVVIGPDQNPGPNYGQPVRYIRVTRNPGKNQYAINYANLAEPDWVLLGYPAPPAVYTPTDFVSAVLQPRYKAGYIQLNSDPNLPLPGNAAIVVSYKFQFSRPGDTVAVDYDTRQLISILLTIRNYPQSTAFPNPQTMTLQGTAPVRNFIR
ncbi:MAG: type II secretion system protein [Methanoregulaceae archaeon]|nr:type II secretion system protein [Methanoregulaceae archaeon]